MKKSLIIAIAASLMMFSGINASAQISLGAGYANTTQKVKLKGVEKNLNMNGVYVGFDYNVPVADNFGIAPGIYYNFSTGVANNLVNIPSIGGLLEGRLDEHYIDIPVNFNFSVPFDNNRFFAYAGPTISCGLSSVIKADASFLGINIKGDVLNLYKRDLFERLDILIGGGVGVDLNNLVRINLGYSFGMFDRLPNNGGKAGEGEGDNYASGIGKLITNNASITRNVLHAGVSVLF